VVLQCVRKSPPVRQNSPATVSDPASSTLGGRAPASDQGLEEIIVTADKRSESINKVPLAITALSGNALQDQNIHSVQDLALVVPGIHLRSFAASILRYIPCAESGSTRQPLPRIRMSAFTSIRFRFPSPVLTQNISLDLERVEVLKGPQGVLFGQNSTGGAINYIAAKPTDKPEAGFDFGYGRFNDTAGRWLCKRAGRRHANCPICISDRANGPVATFVQHVRRNRPMALFPALPRGLLIDWKPTDRLMFEFNANGSVDRSEPIAPQLIGVSLQAPDSPVNGPFLLAYPHAPNNADAADYSL